MVRSVAIHAKKGESARVHSDTSQNTPQRLQQVFQTLHITFQMGATMRPPEWYMTQHVPFGVGPIVSHMRMEGFPAVSSLTFHLPESSFLG